MNYRLFFSFLLAAAILLATAFAPFLCPFDPNEQDLTMSLRPPEFQHPMGTDQYGRDMLSRVIIGSRTSIFSSLALVAIITALGTALGVTSGLCGKTIDAVLMRLADVCLAFPGLVLALFVVSVLKAGILNAVIAIAVVSWPKYARLSRSMVQTLKESEFICAAKMSGLSGLQITIYHILPNIIGPIIVTAMLDIGSMTMELAGLSFLGLGAQPPAAEWGSMMSTGRSMLQTYPWVVISPGIAIFLTVSIFNMLGDSVRDYFDQAHK